MLKSTTRCLPKNARLTNNGDPPGRRIFDQFLRGQTSLRAFFVSREMQIHRRRERERAKSPGKRSACNRCSRKGETAISLIGRVPRDNLLKLSLHRESFTVLSAQRDVSTRFPRMRTRVRMCNSSGETRRVQPRMPNLSHGINHWFAGNDLCVCVVYVHATMQ